MTFTESDKMRHFAPKCARFRAFQAQEKRYFFAPFMALFTAPSSPMLLLTGNKTTTRRAVHYDQQRTRNSYDSLRLLRIDTAPLQADNRHYSRRMGRVCIGIGRRSCFYPSSLGSQTLYKDGVLTANEQRKTSPRMCKSVNFTAAMKKANLKPQ